MPVRPKTAGDRAESDMKDKAKFVFCHLQHTERTV